MVDLSLIVLYSALDSTAADTSRDLFKETSPRLPFGLTPATGRTLVSYSTDTLSSCRHKSSMTGTHCNGDEKPRFVQRFPPYRSLLVSISTLKARIDQRRDRAQQPYRGQQENNPSCKIQPMIEGRIKRTLKLRPRIRATPSASAQACILIR